MSPVLLGADIEESLFLRRFFPDSAQRTRETSAGLRAALSALDTARRKTTPSPRENARLPRKSGRRKWSGGSDSCYGARGGLAGGVLALVNRAVGGSGGQWERARAVGTPGVGSWALP